MKPRYLKMALSNLGPNHIHKRNPWVAIAASIALPGFGHFYCHSYLRGAILMSWEIIVNQMGRINHGILLTVLGHYDKAQVVVDYRWAIIYPVFYVLAIWDSYRVAVDINKLVELEERQPVRHFSPMSLTSVEIVFLSKKNPWAASFLSLVMGGAGHFYNWKLFKALIMMGWHLVTMVNAGIGLAAISMFQGNWDEVHAVIDYQWLLFVPSIVVFNAWNSYVDSVELNKLYEEEIEHYLRTVTSQEGQAGTSGDAP